MVYPADDALLNALQDSHEPSYIAQAFYGAEQTELEIPLAEEGSLDLTADGQIQTSGTVYVRRDSNGKSLVPKEPTDSLAAYGQDIAISRKIVSGDQEWTIPMGRFPIQEVPDMQEYFRRFPSLDPSNPDNDRNVVVSWEAQLRLTDRFDWIRGADFLQPTAPVIGNSTWAEIQRLSPIPIVRSLPDVALPASLAYNDSRFDAITTLMDNLGGEPALTRQGSLTARVKDAWLVSTVPVFEITGTIGVHPAMSSKDLYNAVRARSSVADSTIVGIAQILADKDPLRVGGPFNGGAPKVYGYASPLLDTQAAADAAAATVLSRVSTQSAQTIDVECLPNPLLDLGDYGIVHDALSGTTYTGAIASMSFSLNPRDSMKLMLVVSDVEEG